MDVNFYHFFQQHGGDGESERSRFEKEITELYNHDEGVIASRHPQPGNQTYCPVEIFMKTEDQILNQISAGDAGAPVDPLDVSQSQDEESCKNSAYGQPRKMYPPPQSEPVATAKDRSMTAMQSWPLEDQSQMSESNCSGESVIENDSVRNSESSIRPMEVDIKNVEEIPGDLSDAVSVVSKWGQFLPVGDEDDHDAFDCSYDLNSPFKNSIPNTFDTRTGCTKTELLPTTQTSLLRNRAGLSEEVNSDPASLEPSLMDNSNKLKYSFRDTSKSKILLDNSPFDQKCVENDDRICKTTQDRSSYSFKSHSNVAKNTLGLPQKNMSSPRNQCVGVSPSILCLDSSPSLYTCNSPDLRSPGSQPHSPRLPETWIHTPLNQTVPGKSDSHTTSQGSSPVCQIVPDVEGDSPVESVVLNSLEKKFNTPVMNPATSPNILLATKVCSNSIKSADVRKYG